jgi:hypothetical protein
MGEVAPKKQQSICLDPAESSDVAGAFMEMDRLREDG